MSQNFQIPVSQFSFEGVIKNGEEQNIQLVGGFGLEVFQRVRLWREHKRTEFGVGLSIFDRLCLLIFFSLFQQHRFRALKHFRFFFIQLLQKPLRPQIEGTAWLLVPGSTLAAVMKAPTGRATFQCSAQISQKVCRGRFPRRVTAPKWFLVMHGYDPPELFHETDDFPGFAFGFVPGLPTPRPVRTEEIRPSHFKSPANVCET
jgi:hypothetical protein